MPLFEAPKLSAIVPSTTPPRLTWIAVGLVLAWCILRAVISLQDTAACYIGCVNCDMAVWRTLEMKLESPELFTRDRLFTLQLPVFPTAFSRGLITLREVTGSRDAAEQLAGVLLAALFLCGLALACLAITRDDVASALIVALTALSYRPEITTNTYWGLPNLKPIGVVLAAAPLLLWLLYRAIERPRSPYLFAVGAALTVYLHAPAGVILLTAGMLAYLGARGIDRQTILRLAGASAAAIVVLLPFIASQLDAALDAGPPMDILRLRAPYALFPGYTTLANFAVYLLFPLTLALFALPQIRRAITPLALRFLACLTAASALITLLGAGVHVDTGIAKFIFPSATLWMYFVAFVVIGVAAARIRTLQRASGAVLVAGIIAMLLGLDTRVVRAAEQFKNELKFGAAPAPQAEPVGLPAAVDECSLPRIGSWIRANTPVDALLLIHPLELDAGFRFLSARSAVVVDKDGGNAKYSRAIAVEWQERTDAVIGAYAAGTWQALESVAGRYGAEYVLAPVNTVTPDAALSDGAWKVVALAPGAGAAAIPAEAAR